MSRRLVVPIGTIRVNQLHEELLQAFPSWRGTRRADGSFENPLVGVESTPTEIRLTLPDDANDDVVQRVIAAHVPRVPRDRWRDRQRGMEKLKALGLTEAELSALFG